MKRIQTQSLEQFDSKLAKFNLRGQWKSDEVLVRTIGGPQPVGRAHRWRWPEVSPLLFEACEVLPESYTARRHLGCTTPGLDPCGATNTIRMGLQIARPGEIAWAHRHTIAAIRFVVQGSPNAYTTVGGEICPMDTHDLILTPSWSWHEHHNESDEPVVWLDVLDASLVASLNATFYEPYPGERSDTQETAGKDDSLRSRLDHLPYLPASGERPQRGRLPLRYPWGEAKKCLEAMRNSTGSPYDGVFLEYANPVSGSAAFPTLSCWIQMLRPGECTRQHRHTSSAVYLVVEGRGETIVGEDQFEWSQHDVFAVPNWSWHQHKNLSRSEAAILFSVSDYPVFRALGLYREEPEESLQTMVAPAVLQPSGHVRKQ